MRQEGQEQSEQENSDCVTFQELNKRVYPWLSEGICEAALCNAGVAVFPPRRHGLEILEEALVYSYQDPNTNGPGLLQGGTGGSPFFLSDCLFRFRVAAA